MQNTMQIYSDDCIKERNVSNEREKRLNDRIDSVYSLDACRDNAIKEIGNDLKKLTDMFVDKQINDYRWEIINFAANISAQSPCTKDAYKHCFQTYTRYEKILEENGIKIISGEGEPFDFNLQNAVAHVTDVDLPENTVKQVMQTGYVYKGKVLRTASVIVAN
jgi:molecular chaperone GrpE (heat shock protein)